MNIDVDALQEFVDKARKVQAMLNEMGVGVTDFNETAAQPRRRRQRRQDKAPPLFSRARVLGAMEQGANDVGAIASAIGMDDAVGRRRASAALHTLKQDGLVRRRGKNKWGLTARGQERVKE